MTDQPHITPPDVKHLELNPHQDAPPMMKCGHSANGMVSATGAPCCVICAGLGLGAEEIVETPSLERRMARCHYQHKRNGRPHDFTNGEGLQPSSPALAFFSHQPDKAEDDYYCGCWGWD